MKDAVDWYSIFMFQTGGRGKAKKEEYLESLRSGVSPKTTGSFFSPFFKSEREVARYRVLGENVQQ